MMQRREVMTAAGPVSVLDFGGRASAPRLHFLHATGLNAQVYVSLLAPLAEHFRIIASDARGHGMTRLAADPAVLLDWEVYADDLLALLAVEDADASWLLAGHSMGATVSLRAAILSPARVAGLALVDPAMVPFEYAADFATTRAAAREAGTPLPNPLADQAARRRSTFAGVPEVRAAYAGRGMFRTWPDAEIDAYLAGGLVPDGDAVRLACAPAWEAATFRGVETRTERYFAALDRPFALIAGETGSTVAAADLPTIAASPQCLSAIRIVGTTHFLPFERADLVRAAIFNVADAAFGEVAR